MRTAYRPSASSSPDHDHPSQNTPPSASRWTRKKGDDRTKSSRCSGFSSMTVVTDCHSEGSVTAVSGKGNSFGSEPKAPAKHGGEPDLSTVAEAGRVAAAAGLANCGQG